MKQALGKLSKGDQEPDATVVCADVLKSFGNLQGPFDVVFADPPYADIPFELVADGLQANGLVAKDGIVMLEHFHKTVLPDVLAGLSLVTRRQYGDSAVSVYRPDGVRVEEDEVGTGEGA
jgi:16S rRNA (guanine966-N2)-methyltransferase